MNYVYGIDIGGTSIKIGLFTKEQIELIEVSQIPTPTKNCSTEIFDSILKEIDNVNYRTGISMLDVTSIGLAVPCPVKNGFVSQCANIDWQDLDIVHEMSKRIEGHISVAVSNDANLAAFGENMSLDIPFSNVVFFTMGTGIGGGIIINDNIIEGKLGNGGEIGHMFVSEKIQETCGCGMTGCLEQFCGTKGILNFSKELLERETSKLSKIETLTIKDIFDAAKDGDIVACKVVDRVAEYMGRSASVLAVSLDPEAFIVGGGISKAGEFLIERIKKSYKEYARFQTGEIPFLLARTGNDAGMIGAAHFANKYKKKR